MGAGLTQVQLGDWAIDTNTSLIWKGSHTFAKPIVFARNQLYDTGQLFSDSQSYGDLLYFNNVWSRLPIGGNQSVLTVVNGLLKWSNPDLNSASGILSTSKGGTGQSSFTPGLVITSGNVFSTVPIGEENSQLVIKNGKPVFSLQTGDSGTQNKLVLWGPNGNQLVDSPINIQESSVVLNRSVSSILFENGLNPGFKSDYATFSIGINSELVSKVLDSTKCGVAISLSSSYNYPVFSINVTKDSKNSTIWSVDSSGCLVSGTVPVSLVSGTIPVEQGGTGIVRYSGGDLIYAVSTNKLGILSSRGAEGYILQIKNGMPTWVPFSFSSDNTQSNITVSKTQDGQAPIIVQNNSLLTQPTAGSFEFSDELYFTNSKLSRRQFAYLDSDISGKSRTITEILPLELGGTGFDLSKASSGSLVCAKSSSTLGYIPLGPKGSYLKSDGGEIPIWSMALSSVNALPESGINVSDIDNGNPTLSINTDKTFNPLWKGSHVFQSQVQIKGKLTLQGSKKQSAITFVASVAPDSPNEGDMWYDGIDFFVCKNGSVVNISDLKTSNIVNSTSPIMHYICIASGITPKRQMAWPVKVPLPFGCNNWQIVRLDVRAEIPSQNDTSLDLCINGEHILAAPIVLKSNTDSISVSKFDTPFAKAGSLVQLSFGEVFESDLWSVWILVESM